MNTKKPATRPEPESRRPRRHKSASNLKEEFVSSPAHRQSPAPHGGRLIQRVLEGKKAEDALRAARTLPCLTVNREVIVNMEMIATGVLSPLEGFMGQKDYQSVLDRGRLANGLPWTMPITLAPSGHGREQTVDKLKEGQEVALLDEETREPVAILHLEEKYPYDKAERARKVFATEERRHPGVDHIFRNLGDVLLAGKIDLLKRTHWGPFEKYRLEPKDTWRIFYEERKWKTVVAFQTANPLHRGHEYLQKCALEIYDGLFIHPIVETTRKAYFRNEFRILAYEAAIDLYYPKDRVVLAPLRVTMNYAGPREAIQHALIRKNCGCTHFILGRDHAGFGKFYSPYAAQEIFDTYQPDELGITPIFFKESFYCTRCSCVATEKTCPHSEEFHITMSGTGVQDILRYGYLPPKEVLRPEIGQIIIQGIQPKGLNENGVAIRPPADTVKGLFPSYITHHRLAGTERDTPLDPAALTLRDIEIALKDVRENAGRIYRDIYEAIAHRFDTSRALENRPRTEALAEVLRRQRRLIEMLEEKVDVASETVPDPFMYQDKEEARRELEVAKRILQDIQKPLDPDDFKHRIWNPMEYDKYTR
jgi:sulfate adenylyltransferase